MATTVQKDKVKMIKQLTFDFGQPNGHNTPPVITPNNMAQSFSLFTSQETEEWYTPPAYIEAARQVMAEIDLDPASCPAAQSWIKARRFFTAEDDGLSQNWLGRVWLNPPYNCKSSGRSNQQLWSQKLLTEHQSGRVSEAILLVSFKLGYNWFNQLFDHHPLCLVRDRIRFIRSDGVPGGKAKVASAFFYFGPNLPAFRSVFEKFGLVVTPGRGN